MEKTLDHARPMSREPIKLLVMTGLFAALGCVSTMILQVPSPTGGYMNLGDAVVILGAWLLGPVYGAVAGGVGPALADLLSGYPMYVPATLVIKALMALTAALLYRALGRRDLLLCALAAEIPMVLGYWLFDAGLAPPAPGRAQSFMNPSRRRTIMVLLPFPQNKGGLWPPAAAKEGDRHERTDRRPGRHLGRTAGSAVFPQYADIAGSPDP